jgi:adenylate kinase
MTLADSVLLLGPPASGKGTQSALLARKYAVPHVSLGEILKSQLQCGGEFAEQARPFLVAGEPVPVSLMRRVLRSRLCASDVNRGFVGDGLVRTLAQAHELDKILADLRLHLRLVFHIQVSREELLLRTRNRLWCPRCGASYGRESISSDRPGLCRDDDEPLVQRADDSVKVFEHRIRTHSESLPGIAGYYRGQGILAEIDGERVIDAVHADITATLMVRATRGVFNPRRSI